MYDPPPVHVGLAVDTVGLGQDQFQVLRSPPRPAVIPPLLRTHLHLHVDLIRKTKGANLGTFKGSNRIRTMGYRGVLGSPQWGTKCYPFVWRVEGVTQLNSFFLYYRSDRCSEVCLSR